MTRLGFHWGSSSPSDAVTIEKSVLIAYSMSQLRAELIWKTEVVDADTLRSGFMTQTPTVTIIIATYERVAHLCRLLRELERQTYPREQLEVIVVDDASPTDPREAIARLGLALKLTVLTVPHGGPARARNVGLSHATGELVLFLNDDVRAALDLVDVHVNVHRSLETPAAVLGTFCFTHELRQDPFCRVLEDYGFTHTLQLKNGAWYDYHTFWTGNLSLPRAALQFVGGFHQDFVEPSHDDLELGYRLERELGLKVYYSELARCRHDHHHDPQMWRRRNRMVGRNILRMHRLHGLTDLRAFQEGPNLSRTRLMAAREALDEQRPSMDALESALISTLTRASVGKLQGEIDLDGTLYHLPAQLDAFLNASLSLLTRHDQLQGLVQAALELPELAP